MRCRDISVEISSGQGGLTNPNSMPAAPYEGGLLMVTALFAQCNPGALVLEVLPLSHPHWFGTGMP